MCIGRKTFRQALWHKASHMDIRNGCKKGKQAGEVDQAGRKRFGGYVPFSGK
jgi:hypothetical protein